MKSVAVQGFGKRVHLGQQLELVPRGQQLSICLFDFVATAGDDHQAEDVLAQKVDRVEQRRSHGDVKDDEKEQQRERQRRPPERPELQRHALDRRPHEYGE